jgi:hypothetical protein
MIREKNLFYAKTLAFFRIMCEVWFVVAGAVRGLRRAWR